MDSFLIARVQVSRKKMVRQGPGDFGGGSADDGSDGGGSSSGGSSGSDDSFDRRDQERDVVTSPPSGGGGGNSGDDADAGDIDDALDRGSDTAAGGGGTVAPDDDDDSDTGSSSPTGGEDQTTTRRMEEAERTRPGGDGESGAGGETIAQGVESGVSTQELGGTSAVSQADQVQQQAAEIEQQYASQRQGIGRDDVRVDVVRRDGELRFQTRVSPEARRQAAAREFQDPADTQGGVDLVTGFPAMVTEEDIELTDDGAEVTEEGQRERAATAFQQRGVDVDESDVQVSDGRAQLTESAQERIAAERVETQSGRQAISTALGAAAGIGGVQTGADLGQTVDDETARAFGMQHGRDFTVETTDDGVNVETTEEFRERQVAQQMGVDSSVVEEGEDYRVRESDPADTEGGVDLETGFRGTSGIELTAEGRQTAIEAQAVEQGEVAVGRPEADVPGFGTIGGGERTVDIESPNQLEFDDEGNLTNVREAPTTGADIQAGKERLAGGLTIDSQLGALADEYDVDLGQGGTSPLGQATAEFAFASREGVQFAGDVSTDVGSAFQEEVINPTADLAGDVVDLGVQTGQAFNPLSSQFLEPEAGADVVRAGQDVLRPESEEVGDTGVAEGVTQKLTAGGLGVARAGIELPDTVATGTEVAGEAGAFAVQNPVDESLVAAGETTVQVGETVATQAVNNPIRTAGALGGSGAIFRASRSVGPRTNVATRAAIQPGEELLGAGGGRITRAVAGNRAADRLFPNDEPLIFSEEAAFSAAGRVSSGLRSVGSRARGFARGDVRPSPRQADLIERGRPVAEAGETLGEGQPVAGARSEPLGSPTENIVAATTSGTRRQRTPSVEGETQEQTAATEGTDSPDELPLFEDIQEAGGTRPFIRGEDLPGERPIRMEQTSGIRQLIGEERGQATLAGPRGRTRTEVETEQRPEFEDFDQLEVERQQELEARRELQSDLDPVGRSEGPQQRMREAQQPFETETEVSRDVPRVETALDVDVRPQVDVDARQSPLADLRVGQEPAMDTRSALDVESRTDQRLDLELESEQETRQEIELERELRQERETEFENELERETESRRELEREPDTDVSDGVDFGGVEGVSEDIFADFRDPLTGETLQTKRDRSSLGVFDI